MEAGNREVSSVNIYYHAVTLAVSSGINTFTFVSISSDSWSIKLPIWTPRTISLNTMRNSALPFLKTWSSDSSSSRSCCYILLRTLPDNPVPTSCLMLANLIIMMMDIEPA